MDSFEDRDLNEMTDEELKARYIGPATLRRIAGVTQTTEEMEEEFFQDQKEQAWKYEAAKSKGAFESLMELIEKEIDGAEGGWSIENGSLVITQRVSRDPSRSNNGGEYDYWICFHPDGFGVEVWESWSCDIGSRQQYGGIEDRYDCLVSLDGLERMVKLATITTAAKAWLRKEKGCMAKLKTAIRALGE